MSKIYRFFKIFHKYDDALEFMINHQLNLKIQFKAEEQIHMIMYAWTDNKKYKKLFMEQRSNDLIYSEIEMDEDELHSINATYKESKLGIREFKTYNPDKNEYEYVKILSTFAEWNVVTEFRMEVFGTIIDPVCVAPYIYLKDEYIGVLDIMLYTVYHDLYHAENISIEEYVDYNLSYDQTPYGKPVKLAVRSMDEFELFLNVFKDTFR